MQANAQEAAITKKHYGTKGKLQDATTLSQD